MNDFNRIAMNAEIQARIIKEREETKFIKHEIYLSTNLMLASLDKLIERFSEETINEETINEDKHLFADLYNHIGKIKGLL